MSSYIFFSNGLIEFTELTVREDNPFVHEGEYSWSAILVVRYGVEDLRGLDPEPCNTRTQVVHHVMQPRHASRIFRRLQLNERNKVAVSCKLFEQPGAPPLGLLNHQANHHQDF